MDQNSDQQSAASAQPPETPAYDTPARQQPQPPEQFSPVATSEAPVPTTDSQSFAAPSYDQPQQVPAPPSSEPLAPVTPTTPIQSTENPGLVYGIIGIVLSFLFLAPIGLALSIIGVVKSRKSHASAVVSVIGIVLNSLALLVALILLLITFVAYNGVQDRAADVKEKSDSMYVDQQTEAY